MFGKNRLCISLEENQVRLLLGRARGKQVIVDGFGSFRLADELGDSLDPGRVFAVGESIREFAKREGWRAKRYMLSLNRRGIVARTVRVPALKPSLLEQFLRSEMRTYLPVDPQYYVSDYAILRRFQEGPNESYYEVFLAAVPKFQVDQVGIMAQAWDASVEAVEVVPRSLLRLLQTFPCPDTVILNLRQDGGSVMITQTGGLLVHADLPFSNSMGINAYALAGEVRGYLDFYSSRNQGKTVDTVWLAGETGNNEENLEQLAAFLPVPVEFMTPRRLGLVLGGSQEKSFSNTKSQFVALVGVLLRKE